ncbi:MAG: hypothetical protein ACLQUZ_15660 [Rhizomicrobium sp.]
MAKHVSVARRILRLRALYNLDISMELGRPDGGHHGRYRLNTPLQLIAGETGG